MIVSQCVLLNPFSSLIPEFQGEIDELVFGMKRDNQCTGSFIYSEIVIFIVTHIYNMSI